MPYELLAKHIVKLNAEVIMESSFVEEFCEVTDAVEDALRGGAVIEWDSLMVISTIALADQHYNVVLDGKLLLECATLTDVLRLIELKRAV